MRTNAMKDVQEEERTDRPSSRLKEPKQKVHRNDEEVPKRYTETEEIIPERNIDQEKTNSTSKQSNRQNSSWIEGVTQFPRNDVTGSIGPHKDGVHL